MKWLDGIPLWLIVLVAVYMLLAPLVPEPHLWQKLKMLFAGELARPIAIVDLVWHAVPVALLGLETCPVATTEASLKASRWSTCRPRG